MARSREFDPGVGQFYCISGVGPKLEAAGPRLSSSRAERVQPGPALDFSRFSRSLTSSLSSHRHSMPPPHRAVSVTLLFAAPLKSKFIPRHPLFRYRMASTTAVRAHGAN